MEESLESLVVLDINSWAIANQELVAQCVDRDSSAEEIIDMYWSTVLSAEPSDNFGLIDLDGNEPFTDWGYSSPQPEVNVWDSN